MFLYKAQSVLLRSIKCKAWGQENSPGRFEVCKTDQLVIINDCKVRLEGTLGTKEYF